MKKRFSEEQIIGFLREADAGLPIKELCREHGFSDASYYLWRSNFGGMAVSDARRLKDLETVNARLIDILCGLPPKTTQYGVFDLDMSSLLPIEEWSIAA